VSEGDWEKRRRGEGERGRRGYMKNGRLKDLKI